MMAKRISCLCILLLFVLGISSICQAKSVFAVASHQTSKVKAYLADPADGTVDFQKTMDHTEHFGNGATGLATWTSIDRMFVTYESDERIAWGSTRTLTRDWDDEIYAPESSLAGVIADETNDVLYVVTRSGGHLYTYTFDEAEDTLVLEHPNDPEYPSRKYRQLEGLESGNTFGLALDEDGGEPYFTLPTGLLYAANGSNIVRYYNTMTWELVGSIDMGRGAVGIAVAVQANGNSQLYAGGYFATPAHDFLVRYDLNGDPNDIVEKDMGYRITDIIIDNDTGVLYTTTRQKVPGNNNLEGALEVYDVSGWSVSNPTDIVQIDIETDPDYSGPGGIGIGSQYKTTHGMFIEKLDDVTGTVIPGDYYDYDITYRPGPSDESNVVITDKLPDGVDFVSAYPVGEYLEWPDHKYVWELGNLPGCGDPNICTHYYFTLTVQVNDTVEAMTELYNVVEAESDVSYVEDDELTQVGCWGGDVIFVDASKPAGGGGTSWADAYSDLQEALARAGRGCGTEIWVANGTYSPGNNPEDSFVLPDGVSVYGGFAGDETLRDERDWIAYKTVLNGGFVNTKVVTMKDGAVLDGCVVVNSFEDGIYGDGVDFKISNCVIENNSEYGVRAFQGNPSIYYCTICGNGRDGVYAIGIRAIVRIENCKIYNNNECGVNCFNSTPTVLNSEVYYNNYYGIRCILTSYIPTIRNCTIVGNSYKGIYCSGDGTHYADVRNCIVHSNNANDDQFGGLCSIHNSCFNDPNNPSGSETPNDYGNITIEPGFAYPEMSGNFHLAYDSVCIAKGDNSVVDPNGFGESDIDLQTRIVGTYVDIGADEVACSDLLSEFDENDDLIVNYIEFASFANSWGKTEADADWNSIHSNYNYVNVAGEAQDVVNIADLDYWTYEWLWEPCWLEGNGSVYDRWLRPIVAAQQSSMMMPMGVEIESTAVETQPVEESFFTSEEIIDFFESLLDDSEVLKLIDEKDLKKFIKSLESDLSVDLP